MSLWSNLLVFPTLSQSYSLQWSEVGPLASHRGNLFLLCLTALADTGRQWLLDCFSQLSPWGFAQCSWEFQVCGTFTVTYSRKTTPSSSSSQVLQPWLPLYGLALAHTWVVKAFCCFTAYFVSLKNNVSSENNSKHSVCLGFPLVHYTEKFSKEWATNK